MSELLSGEALHPELLLPLGWLVLAMGALSLILTLGRRIGSALQLRLWGIPEALVAGLLGLLLRNCEITSH